MIYQYWAQINHNTIQSPIELSKASYSVYINILNVYNIFSKMSP